MKCIIVDANALGDLFCDADNTLVDLRKAVLFGARFQVASVIGGKLFDEYYERRRMTKLFAELRRGGRLIVQPRGPIDEETAMVSKLPSLESNDPHVIALARVAAVRVLCTFDQALESDFKKKELIDNPRGKIYKDRTHDHLLR